MSAAEILRAERAGRANGERPRPTDPDLDAFLWSTLGLSGRMAARKIKPYGLELDAGDSRRRVPRAVEPDRGILGGWERSPPPLRRTRL
jgi:hypothetical protein